MSFFFEFILLFDFFLKIYVDKVDRFLTNDFFIVERAKRNEEKTSEKKIKKIAAIDQIIRST